MKQWILYVVLVVATISLNGCCGDCDQVNNTLLKVQVIDKQTKEDISKNLDENTFYITQLSPSNPVILPNLEFKNGEILAQFPVDCVFIELTATLEISILGRIAEKMVIGLKTTTKSCCGCEKAKGTIKSLTVEKGSKVNLGLNSNTLRIEI
jgi:hypothetical protein